MNIYFIAIIGFLIFEYLLSFIVRLLNLKALDPNLPNEFEDTFDSQKYLDSQNYTRTNSKFSYITSTFSLIVSLVFIFGGVYNIIDQFVRSFGYGDILTGLFFFGGLFIITDILNSISLFFQLEFHTEFGIIN